MPANVTFEFDIARKKYEDAKTDPEKLMALQEMLRTAPKHKGSETLIRDITKKIGELRRKMQKQREFEKARTKKSAAGMTVKKEGAGQVVLVGAPNSGKSFLVKKLTHAETEVAPYPFTTVQPIAGMMNFKGARVQLVDLPAVIENSSSGKMQGTQVLSIVRNADSILMPVRQADEFGVNIDELAKSGIRVIQARPNIQVSESRFGGISIAGKEFLNCPEEEAMQFIKGLGFDNLNVVLFEKTSLKDLADVLDSRITFKKALVVCFDEKTFDEVNNLLEGLVLERVKEKLRESIKSEVAGKLEGRLRNELKKDLMKWFGEQKSADMQKRLKRWMKEGEQDRIERQVEAELNEKLNAKLDSMTENRLNELLEKETEKEFSKRKKELLEKERLGLKLMLLTEKNFDGLRKELFDLLDVVMIFTKKPGQEPDFNEPLILKKGSTAEAAALVLHKELAKKLKYVKVWGSSKFPGQRVAKNYKLKNEDIIEIYA